MKQFKMIIAVLFMLMAISCNDAASEGGDNGGSDKPAQRYGTAEEAANAGKADMLKAMENGVNFGIDRGKLQSASAGTPIMKQMVNFDALLQPDTTGQLDKLVTGEAVTAVPLIIGPEVVSIVTLRNENNQFAIGELGNMQLSTELNTVSQATQGRMANNVTIYEVPNLNATIYAVRDTTTTATGAQGVMYYTSYNNMSPRQPIDGASLMRLLQADAQAFEKQFGAEVKKGKLVK